MSQMAVGQGVARGLLGMIASSEGRKLDSRIRVQKLAFLLQAKGVAEFQLMPFAYHHYGPYSRELSAVVQDLVLSGLLKEEREEFAEDNVRYSYELTPRGREYLSSVGSDEKEVAEVVSIAAKEHWRTLELAATVLFLQRGRRWSRAEALGRALELKPACAPFEERATQLLEAMCL